MKVNSGLDDDAPAIYAKFHFHWYMVGGIGPQNSYFFTKFRKKTPRCRCIARLLRKLGLGQYIIGRFCLKSTELVRPMGCFPRDVSLQ